MRRCLGDGADGADLCNHLGGRHEVIGATHPLSPPEFTNGRDELHIDRSIYRPDDWQARPHLCTVDKLDLVLISFFQCVRLCSCSAEELSYGLATLDEFVQEEAMLGMYVGRLLRR